MKKALKITGIVFGALLLISAIFQILTGAVIFGMTDDIVKEMVKQNANMTTADAQTWVTGLATFFIIFGVYIILGAILSFVTGFMSKDENPSKAKFITLGVFNIIFGSAVVGVISIVHGAKNGN